VKKGLREIEEMGMEGKEEVTGECRMVRMERKRKG